MMRFGAVATFIATLVVTGPAAQAATTYHDSVSGIEIYATPTEGIFSGTASGDLPGVWYAEVEHTPLDPGATITGGYTTVATYLGLVEGDFIGGTVTLISHGSGCKKQRYDVEADLANVGVGGGTGTGSFSGILTHLRKRVFGICITYSATITGSLTFNF
jgi:hypothetical protein